MSDNSNFYMPQLQGFSAKTLKVKNHTKKAGSFTSDAAVGSVSVVMTPNSGNRVAYVTGSGAEKLYSADAVERTYILNADTTVNVVFDEPLDKKPLLKILDESCDPNTPSTIKEMFYAYRLQALPHYRHVGSG